MANVFILKEAHHIWDHHNEGLHCNSSGTDYHFHALGKASISCFICNFSFSPIEKEVVGPLAIKAPSLCTSYSFYQEHAIVLNKVTLPPLRAPPIFIG